MLLLGVIMLINGPGNEPLTQNRFNKGLCCFPLVKEACKASDYNAIMSMLSKALQEVLRGLLPPTKDMSITYIIKGGYGVGRFLSSLLSKISRNWQPA